MDGATGAAIVATDGTALALVPAEQAASARLKVAGATMMVHGASRLKASSNGGGNSNETGSWGKGSFDSPEESLKYHFKKHGSEVGAKDSAQYLR